MEDLPVTPKHLQKQSLDQIQPVNNEEKIIQAFVEFLRQSQPSMNFQGLLGMNGGMTMTADNRNSVLSTNIRNSYNLSQTSQ